MTTGLLRLKAVCSASDTSAPTVRQYAALGLIDCERDSNGNWLFPASAPAQVQRIKAERMAKSRIRKAG